MGCCFCCKKREQEHAVIPEGGIDQKRGCTDVLCCLFMLIWMIVWLIISVIGITTGEPKRLVKPTDYRGNVCGEDSAVAGKTRLFVPNIDVRLNTDFGICVENCPEIGDYICRYQYQNETEAKKLTLLGGSCWYVFYESESVLWRCLPSVVKEYADNNVTSDKVLELVDRLNAGQYVRRGWGEVFSARWAIFLACITAVVVTIIWVILIRWIIKPLVYITIFGILLLLVIVGTILWVRAKKLEKVTAQSDVEGQDQIETYKAFSIIFFIMAAIYLMLLVWLLSRIRIAIEIIKEGSKALIAAKSMIFVPPITYALMILMGVWWVFVTAHIASMGEFTEEDLVYGNYSYQGPGKSLVPVNISSDAAANEAFKVFSHDSASDYMQFFNMFSYYWLMNFIMSLGYFTIVSTVVSWYFSEHNMSGNDKHVPVTVVLQSLKRGVRYHLGSLALGSFCIALIQFVRFLLEYFARKLGVMKDSTAVKAILCMMRCFLAYVERVVKLLTKNAYIMMAIRGKNFCRSGLEALTLLLKNPLRVAATSFISSFVLFLCKILILLSNMVIGWLLLNSPIPSWDLPEGEEPSLVFPMILIGIITFAVAAMFLSLYDDCIDAVLLCFFLEDEASGVTVYYMPKALANLVDKYSDIEGIRQEAEKMMHMKDPEAIKAAQENLNESAKERQKKNSKRNQVVPSNNDSSDI